MTGTETDKFCLRWNEYESNLSSAIQEVREEKCLYDVTVSCDGGGQFPAHRLVLAACSQVMREILCTSSQPSAGPQPHQLVYLRGVNSQDLQFILSFMYRGEVSLAEDKLTSFLAVADNLQVKGLTQNKSPVESIKKTLRRDSPTKSLRLSEPSVIKPQSDDMREVSASNAVKVESVGLNQMLDNREVVEYEAGGEEDMYGEYRSQYEEHNFPFELGNDGGNRNKGRAVNQVCVLTDIMKTLQYIGRLLAGRPRLGTREGRMESSAVCNAATPTG